MNVRELIEALSEFANQEQPVVSPGEDGGYYEVSEIRYWQSISYKNEDNYDAKSSAVVIF